MSCFLATDFSHVRVAAIHSAMFVFDPTTACIGTPEHRLSRTHLSKNSGFSFSNNNDTNAIFYKEKLLSFQVPVQYTNHVFVSQNVLRLGFVTFVFW